MAGINLNKKLWRIPQQGMVRGVCAGIANYFDVPVKLVRILVVLSIFFGLALFTLVAYIILSFALDPMPDTIGHATRPPSSNKLGARSSSAKGISERPEKSLFIADSCPGFSAVRSVHPVFSGSLAA